MELRTLKFFRMIIPGILIAILSLIALANDFNELKNVAKLFHEFKKQDVIYLVLFIIIGVLYYILDIRNLLWKPFHKKVQENIKNTILSPFSANLNSNQVDHLKKERKLMNVFYYFVDNDKSLTEKAKLVRFNGLIWTSLVDLTLISLLGSVVFLVKIVYSISPYNLILPPLLVFISLLSFILTCLTTKKHLSLSNEQLDIICQIHKQELKTKIDELL